MTDELNSQVATTETAPVKKRGFNFQGFTSLLLALVFVAVAFSGVILFLTPRGRTAHWTDWTMLGLGKEEWGTLHINTCAVLLLLAVLHLAFNWRMFFGYLRKKATGGLNLKREMLGGGCVGDASDCGHDSGLAADERVGGPEHADQELVGDAGCRGAGSAFGGVHACTLCGRDQFAGGEDDVGAFG